MQWSRVSQRLFCLLAVVPALCLAAAFPDEVNDGLPTPQATVKLSSEHEEMLNSYAQLLEFIQATPNDTEASPSPLSIDVVFHVLNDTDNPMRLSGWQLRTQIQILNDAFRNASISFNRHNVTHTSVDASKTTKEEANKTLVDLGIDDPSYWRKVTPLRDLHQGDKRTLNFFIMDLQGGALGFTTEPVAVKYSGSDFVVVDPTAMPHRTYGERGNGTAAVHEVGHWFGLFHTSGFIPGSTQSVLGDKGLPFALGDGIADTPPAGNDSATGLNCDEPNGRNFMAFSKCWSEFTPGQVRAIRRLWDHYRA